MKIEVPAHPCTSRIRFLVVIAPSAVYRRVELTVGVSTDGVGAMLGLVRYRNYTRNGHAVMIVRPMLRGRTTAAPSNYTSPCCKPICMSALTMIGRTDLPPSVRGGQRSTVTRCDAELKSARHTLTPTRVTSNWRPGCRRPVT
jgi:hypothetical protein